MGIGSLGLRVLTAVTVIVVPGKGVGPVGLAWRVAELCSKVVYDTRMKGGVS